MVQEASQVGSTIFGFFFYGTGVLAQFILGLISLNLLFSEGPVVSRQLLRLSPLNDDEQALLIKTHKRAVPFAC